ncbi:MULTISPECIES: extracellular solute-binding protein [Cohnella]|uniref:extracellular solute-binding protein n=1 Tax=Cohnella TaxID=329857 RepID=UPI0009BB996C|nr:MULTISPECIES: extracellular solute-binding protein [Cohnella]MBN2982762.1 extracellular solute-binding protein [Cohnella algarum]
MKKNAWSALVVLSLLLLAACSGNTNSGSAAPQSQAPSSAQASSSAPATEESSPLDEAVKSVVEGGKEVSISFWTGTGAANFPVLEQMVAAFQEKYPNIKVDFSNQGAIGELTDKLTQNIVSKSTPTLSNLDASTFPEYIASGAIVDLMPYYEREDIGLAASDSGFFPYYLDEAKSFGPDGTMYGFPTNKKTTDVLVYNKTYFDGKGWAPPKTWDEVVSYSKTIKEETGSPGFSFDNSYGDAPFKLLSAQWGSPYVQDDGTIDIDNDAGREALKFYKENMELGYFTMPALMPSAGGKFSSNGFVMEETYMFVGAAAGVPYAVPKPESGHKDFEVGVAPVPQKDANNPVNFSKGENYAIFSNATEEERVAAWLLISFLSDAGQNATWLTETGNLPISQAMLDEPDYQRFLETEPSDSPVYYRAAAVNAVLSSGDLTFIKTIPQSGALAQAVGEMWEAVMIGGGDPEQLLTEAAAKAK